MARNKLIVFLRLNWLKLLGFFIASVFVISIFVMLTSGFTNFNNLESFSKKQMTAQMGMYLFMGIVQGVIMTVLYGIMYYYLFMGGGMSRMLGDAAEEAKSDVKWSDVIGMEDAKRDALEIVQLLKDAQKVKAIGGSMIKGVLMFGPPGCGKTYLAKAIANEAGLPFLSAVGSEFVGMLMGQGAARVKSLFKKARKLAKVEGGCIIFIDEIDSFAMPRQEDRGFGGATSNNATINQFLTELDGLRKKENNICVFAATNVEPELLDAAVMRSGRFDRKIFVQKPTASERAAIFQYYLSKIKADTDINITMFSEKCQAFSPADISNMVREASLLSMRQGRASVTNQDLLNAMDEIMISIEKTGLEEKILSSKTNVRWDDLIGMEETKKDAWEIVELLRDRHKLKVAGGQIIKGVMMIGPPGCGKTYLAKAIATESGFPFISVTGTDFVTQVWSGTGIIRLKKVFQEARNVAKSEGGCIIFIDEIDAFVRPRDPSPFSNARNSDTSSINEFLTEMDGLKGQNKNIIVIAATNIPEDKLDPAVMRSGRFDRKIYFQRPSSKEREALLSYYIAKIRSEENLDLALLAEKAKSFTAADINNMVRESSLLAMREKREVVSQTDLLKALERVMISVESQGENKILGGKVNVKWDEVIGMNDAKAEAWEIVKLLKDRNLLKAVGGRIVKGVVMFGPPGCGKTYLAKAMATEAGFPFITATGSDLVGIYIGEGSHKMKEIFKEARALAKSEGGCIIFFDEIDAFATPRWVAQDHGASMAHNSTVNQFLTELDGLRQVENNIVVLGATNVSENQLDPAILRAGRLERKIHITKPNLQERKDLFQFYLSKVNIDPAVDPDRLARTTVDFTPSDIDNMIREAGLIAMRENRDQIQYKDLSESYDRLTMGAVTNAKYNTPSLTKTAYHEAGHAIVQYLEHPSREVVKATIRPRRGSLGFIYGRDIEELAQNSPNREQWLAEIKICMAGYVAEKITFGTTASGVGGGPGSDFYSAMNYASFMVWSLGMGPSGLIGDFNALKSRDGNLNISEKTKEILDTDVQQILQGCLKDTTEILSKHKNVLELFAQELLKKGDLEFDEIKAIFDQSGLKPLAQLNDGQTI